MAKGSYARRVSNVVTQIIAGASSTMAGIPDVSDLVGEDVQAFNSTLRVLENMGYIEVERDGDEPVRLRLTQDGENLKAVRVTGEGQ